jgi:hypothetical protein
MDTAAGPLNSLPPFSFSLTTDDDARLLLLHASAPWNMIVTFLHQRNTYVRKNALWRWLVRTSHLACSVGVVVTVVSGGSLSTRARGEGGEGNDGHI